MIYFLKFIASWILPPGIFVILLLVAIIKLFKDNRKTSYYILIVTILFYISCTSLIAEKVISHLENSYTPPITLEDLSADVIVVFGGGAVNQIPDVDGVGILGSSSANRLLAAVRLQKVLNIPILVSGGRVYNESSSEAEISARILKSLGVPEEKILMETKSVNTSQNAKYSARILFENKFQKPILVTSAFHMKRAMINFKMHQVEPIAYPTDFSVSRNTGFHYLKLRPQSEALLLNATALQEILRTFVTETFEI